MQRTRHSTKKLVVNLTIHTMCAVGKLSYFLENFCFWYYCNLIIEKYYNLIFKGF